MDARRLRGAAGAAVSIHEPKPAKAKAPAAEERGPIVGATWADASKHDIVSDLRTSSDRMPEGFNWAAPFVFTLAGRESLIRNSEYAAEWFSVAVEGKDYVIV